MKIIRKNKCKQVNDYQKEDFAKDGQTQTDRKYK